MMNADTGFGPACTRDRALKADEKQNEEPETWQLYKCNGACLEKERRAAAVTLHTLFIVLFVESL